MCLLAFESNFLPRCSSIFLLGNPLFAINDTFIFSDFQLIYFLIIIKCFGDIDCLIINAQIFIEKHSNMIKHQFLEESLIFVNVFSVILTFQVHDNHCDVIVNFSRFAFGNFLQLFQSHSCTCSSLFEGLAYQAYGNQFAFFSLCNLSHLLPL
jgi:hypothetical protein